MASTAPQSCCIQTNFHEGNPKGAHSDIFGVSTYQVGEKNGNEKFVVILTDVYGHKYNNNMLVADEFASAGYHVLIPDILFNDPVPETHGDLSVWFPNHGAEKTRKVVDEFLAALKKTYNPKFVAAVGHCFGAKYAVQHLTSDGLIDVAAVAHPSFVSMEEIKAVKKPLLISAAETDPIFPPESRHATEAALKELGVRYQIDLFSGVVHGYAVRGDPKDPVAKYAKEKTLCDQVYWFNEFSK